MGPLDRKLAALDALGADIAVIPECPRLPASRGTTFWVGTNPHKGLGVVARAPWRITRATRRHDLPRYLQPLRVSGPESFLLWAVWACNVGADRYVRGVHRAVDACARLFGSGPTVMLGDFNSNTIWDHEHPKERSHSALVHKLERHGLTSSYHAFYGEHQGSETRPTFFEYRHQHRPYHIDYCFLPRTWTPRIAAVSLGTHAEWGKRSDHMPLVVDLAPAVV
jgi:hypothetical protein